MKKINKIKNTVHIIAEIFKYVVRTNKKLFFICTLLTALNGVLRGALIYAQQNLFDSASEMVQKNQKLNAVILSLITLAIFHIIHQVLNGTETYVSNMYEEKTKGILALKINEKVNKISPIYFEDPKYLDDITRAEEGKNNAVTFIMTLKDIMTFFIPYFGFMALYFYTLKPVLAFSILLLLIPVILGQIVRTKAFGILAYEAGALQRECNYYEQCIVGKEFFKETRLLGVQNKFKDKYLDTLNELQKKQMKSEMKTNIVEFFMQVITVIGYVCIIILLFFAVIKKEISIGAFSAVFYSIGEVYSYMERMVRFRMSKMSNGFGSICNYIRFLDMKEECMEYEKKMEINDIELKNVSFKYPNAKCLSLNNVSLKIKKGETIAIVGENGSGKTTLVKTICGLYLPTEGTISYSESDDIVKPRELFANISAVFQKYQRYKMSLEDNITISSISKEYSSNDLNDLCDFVDVKVNSKLFPKGLNTMLAREFGGVDLSLGQWQRIAIARGIFKDSELICLDEPTAAIDPVEETKLYNCFYEIGKDKTELIVTHRIGVAKGANRIIVMKNSKLVEEGSHEELMRINGEYKRLFDAQEKWYRNN